MTRRAGLLILAFVLIAALAPLLAPYDPGRTFREFLHAPPMTPKFAGFGLPTARPLVLADRLEQRFEADPARTVPLPWFGSDDRSPVFLLGSDSLGRDELSRLLYGARTSIGLALVATLGALCIGAFAGSLAGLRGGWMDETVMRLADFVLVLPMIYVVLVLRAVLPLVLAPSTVFVLVALIFVLVGWPFVAKGVRAIVAAERDRDYILAARSLGAGPLRLLTRHLIPACAGYLVVQATILLPAFVLAEATLSFVGLGFPDAVPSWGTMLIEAANVGSLARFPWTLSPALAIFLVAMSANALTSQRDLRRRVVCRVGSRPLEF
ncbi:MAG: ABC transporter permease [Vicinamibacterales bacterium]